MGMFNQPPPSPNPPPPNHRRLRSKDSRCRRVLRGGGGGGGENAGRMRGGLDGRWLHRRHFLPARPGDQTEKRRESTALKSRSATAERDGALSWRGREALAICQEMFFFFGFFLKAFIFLPHGEERGEGRNR